MSKVGRQIKYAYEGDVIITKKSSYLIIQKENEYRTPYLELLDLSNGRYVSNVKLNSRTSVRESELIEGNEIIEFINKGDYKIVRK